MTVSEICRQRLVSGVALKGAIEETLVILQAVSRTIPGRLPRCGGSCKGALGLVPHRTRAH